MVILKFDFKRVLVVALSLIMVLVGLSVPTQAADNLPSASGASHIIFEHLITFNFTARTVHEGRSDYYVEGKGKYKNHSTGDRIELDIFCLSINNDNMAIMKGIITYSTDEDFRENSFVEFAVQDNGEGKNAPLPDRIALKIDSIDAARDTIKISPFFEGTDECDNEGINSTDLINITAGNIQVRPGR